MPTSSGGMEAPHRRRRRTTTTGAPGRPAKCSKRGFLQNCIQLIPSLSVVHLTLLWTLWAATMASVAVGAVKAGGDAITITAAANAGIPQVLSDGAGGSGMSTRSYHEHPNNHHTTGGGSHGGQSRQHTPFDEDGYWREVKAIIGGVLGFWGGVGGLGTLFLVVVLSQRYCCRKDDDKDHDDG